MSERLFSLSPRGEGWGEGARCSDLVPLTFPAFGWAPPSPLWGEGLCDEAAS